MHRFQHLDAAGNFVYYPYPQDENGIPQLVSYEEPETDVTNGMGGLAGGMYDVPEVEGGEDVELWRWNANVQESLGLEEQEREEVIREQEEERNRQLQLMERDRERIRMLRLSPAPVSTPTSIPTVTILTSWDPTIYTTESIPIPTQSLPSSPPNGPSYPSLTMNPNQPSYTGYPPQHPQSMYYTHPNQQTTQAPHTGFVPIYTATTSPTLQNPYAQGNTTQYASSATSSNGGPGSPTNGSSSNEDPQALEKRLRNTAASARFRAKKKQREASLERQSREKREALAKLEGRVVELEEENKFLKDLVMEKGEASRRRGGDGGGEGKGKGKERA